MSLFLRTTLLASIGRYFAVIGMLAMIGLPFVPVHAQITDDLAGDINVQTNDTLLNAGYGERQDPRLLVSRIINVFLGLLATVFLVLVLHGGFLWMTAQGNEEQVTKAQTEIKNAVIGLVVILLAYSITVFVTNYLARGAPAPNF